MFIGVVVIRPLESEDKNQVVLESIEDGNSGSLRYETADEKIPSIEWEVSLFQQRPLLENFEHL